MELYTWLTLAHLHDFFDKVGSLIVVVPLGLYITGVMIHAATEGEFPRPNYRVDIFLIVGLIFTLLSCFIPSQRDIALMLGWDAINSDSVHEVIEILKEKFL